MQRTRGAGPPPGLAPRGISLLAGLALHVVVLLLPTVASAGGLNRPNIFSPLGLGIGGAGYAGVPNPSTIHYNPAGMLLMDRTVALGSVELVIAERAYESGVHAREAPDLVPFPVPAAGVSTRFARKGGVQPLPVAFGLAFYNSYGGAAEFDEAEVQPGIIGATLLILELVPAAAYQVTSNLALGIGLRIAFGLFSLTNNETRGVERLPATISGSGLKIGASLGMIYSPTSWLRIGAVYGSPLIMEMEGEGEVESADLKIKDNATVTLPWPQWAALGFAFTPAPAWRLYASIRWTDYSAFQRIVVELKQTTNFIEPLDFSDGVSVHLGATWALSSRISLMGGASYDSNTIPDERIQRAFIDADKLSLSVGASLGLTDALYLDAAYEIVFAPERDVPVGPANPYPGRYSLSNHTLALGFRYLY